MKDLRTLRFTLLGVTLVWCLRLSAMAEEPSRSTTDPSVLTTQAIQREITFLQKEIAAVKEIISTRLEASDKAILLLQQRVDREPQIGVISAQLNALKDLLSERFMGVDIRFAGIDKQFVERDTRSDLSSKSTETAINAALQAQKESVTAANSAFAEATRKAEASTNERLNQLTTLFQTETRALTGQLTSVSKSLDDKIVTLTARLGLIEGSGVGTQSARRDQDTSSTLLIAIMGIVVSIIAVGVALVMAFRNKEHATRNNGV